MSVLVDTSVWSLALRRSQADLNPAEQTMATALSELVRSGQAQITGAIRQELLSGIRDAAQFEKVRLSLRAFPDAVMDAADYEGAARIHDLCRGKGVAGSVFDFLLCAVALHRKWEIFTTDQDFARYGEIVGIALFPAI